MKKIILMAVSAMLVANVNAQEQKKEAKCDKTERTEWQIKRLSEEMYLSDKQAEKFAVTYREYEAKRAEIFEKTKTELENLEAKFKDKFAKDLNERQVERVLREFKPCCKNHGDKPCCKEGFPPRGPECQGFPPKGPESHGKKFDKCRELPKEGLQPRKAEPRQFEGKPMLKHHKPFNKAV